MTDDWRELLPTAFLLAGSDAGARDLLARALARGGGVDALVRAHLRRRVGREVVLSGSPGTPWWVSPADAAAAAELSAGLAGLTRAERAAVVLRWFEDRPADEVARRVPGVDLAGLPGRLGVPAEQLPARLEVLAGTAQLADLDDAAVADGVRAVRRGRWAIAGAAVAVVAVLAVGVTALPDLVRPAEPPATGAPPVPLGPARGSLAGDTEFVADLRDQMAPAPDRARLLYAGDAVGHRWALLVQVEDGGTTATWFTGPTGSPAAAMSSQVTARSSASSTVFSATVEDDRGAALLLVAAPGDEVEVSAGFDVAADGTAARTSRPVGTADGVSAVRLDRAGGGGVVARVSRDGTPVTTDRPVLLQTSASWAGTPLAARSGTDPVDPFAYRVAVEQVTGPTGRRPQDLAVTVLGSGTFPAPGGTTAQAVTVAVVLPTGAVATSTVAGTGFAAQPCGTSTHPAGTDPATLVVVARCASYAGDSSTFGATLVVAAPPGTPVELNTGAGGALTVPALDAGWGFQVDGADDLSVFRAGAASGAVARAGDGPLEDF
ncbi:hypothetical protein [Klenkia taihuensis]|uniref:hypothetical protein n=1 Tax=Klenkia taihuensis TaxID=1225127 RepID=UPI000B86FA57|nr:hypothetical protein [Klenkia taihuensis]